MSTMFQVADVMVDKEFLKRFENKTEVFNKREISSINYACILFCDLECACFLFDKTGKIIGRSKLLFDEADDIIMTGKNQKEVNINYRIISKIQKNKIYTRKEVEDINEIYDYIKKLNDNEKQDELKYLYYECFKKEDAFEKMIYEFNKNINNGNFEIINKINFLLKRINS